MCVGLWVYQIHCQPHPYYGHLDPSTEECSPADPGGDQVLRTGSPFVVDRKTKKRVLEEGRAEFSLIKLIYAPHSIRVIDRVMDHVAVAVAVLLPYIAEVYRVCLYERPWSRYMIKSFVNQYRIDMSHYIEPEGGFRNFQHFFTRQVKPDARPIESPHDDSVVVSPCDCRGLFFNNAHFLSSIRIKGQQFEFDTLIGPELVKQGWSKDNTAFGLLRLNPADYHRYHSPCCGTVASKWHYSSRVHASHGEGNLVGIGTLHENERVVVAFENGPGGIPFIYIPIGATLVGKCFVNKEIGEVVNKGDEVGNFAFGGSTLCLLFRNSDITWDSDLLAYTQEKIEVKILQGQRIAEVKAHSPRYFLRSKAYQQV